MGLIIVATMFYCNSYYNFFVKSRARDFLVSARQ